MPFTRRQWLQTGGLALTGLIFPGIAAHGREEPVIQIRSDPHGAHVTFDPIGLYVELGQTVCWINRENVHTVTAYHPVNDNHSLRIPETAEPWDSGYLVNPGDRFEHRFIAPGVYDYFCAPHEAAGMVGRIVVGEVAGPGALPYNYFSSHPQKQHWRTVPLAAQRRFPSAEAVVRLRRIAACVSLPRYAIDRFTHSPQGRRNEWSLLKHRSIARKS